MVHENLDSLTEALGTAATMKIMVHLQRMCVAYLRIKPFQTLQMKFIKVLKNRFKGIIPLKIAF